MSIVAVSGQAISDNILNHSISKQMYSFPKTKRFHEMKKCSSATFLYNIPNKMSKRKAFIGYGSKVDFTNMNKTNTPYYKITRIFDGKQQMTPDAPKYTFGLGRNYFQKVVINKKISKIESISPGPAKYSYLKPFGSFSPKYSVPKNKVKKLSLGEIISPGPAKYKNNLNINPQGLYSLSRFHNSPCNGWSLSKTQRFSYNCNNKYLIKYSSSNTRC